MNATNDLSRISRVNGFEISAICGLIDSDSREQYKELLRDILAGPGPRAVLDRRRMVGYRARFDAEFRDLRSSFLDIQPGDRDCVCPLHSATPRGGPVLLLPRLRPEVDHPDERCSSGVCPTSA